MPASQPSAQVPGPSPWGAAMSRRNNYRSEVSRDAEKLIWSGVLLAVFAILHFTGLFAAILVWAGDLLLDQIKNIGNMQPE